MMFKCATEGGCIVSPKFLCLNLFPFIVLGLLGRNSFAVLKRRFTALYVLRESTGKDCGTKMSEASSYHHFNFDTL